MNKALIIFIKNPLEGKVKTRLAATLGDKAAFDIYKTLLTHTNGVVKDVQADKYIFYSSHLDANDEWDETKFAKRLQTGKDLGERMRNAFTDLVKRGYERVTIIGSDCPDITTDLIIRAFNELEGSDIVIGPATDGGYYLIALKEIYADLFENISWSTNHVLKQTLAVCTRLNKSVHLLPLLSDVDVEEDLINREEFFLFNKLQ